MDRHLVNTIIDQHAQIIYGLSIRDGHQRVRPSAFVMLCLHLRQAFTAVEQFDIPIESRITLRSAGCDEFSQHLFFTLDGITIRER
ncbi:hypothetical protein A4F85_06650 [Delftia sp. GW456-R20]|nr:hypothetical protein A4F85_06650 [Delftia sp. GW456-R20]